MSDNKISLTVPAKEAPQAVERTPERHVERVQIEKVVDANTDRPYALTRIIRAGMSLNRRLYPAEVLASAAGMYSRAKMMLDHPDMFVGYSVRNLAGIYGEAQYDRAIEGVVAPLYFLTSTEAGRLALAIAQEEASLRNEGVLGPEDFLTGISHVAFTEGHWVEIDDADNDYGFEYYEVDRIEEVMSGDIVVFPAAGGQFLEHLEGVYKSFAQREGWSFAPPREGVVEEGRTARRFGRVKVNINV